MTRALDSQLIESISSLLDCDPCRAVIKTRLFEADLPLVLQAASLCIEHSKATGGDGGDVQVYMEITCLHDVLRYSVFSYLWFLNDIALPSTPGERQLLDSQ
ncbi:MAG: hypothetical protein NXI04_00430 [Planctomycetaceae bacterium]|nr:hypothetical protein [Planctomycetaceae bacterium]